MFLEIGSTREDWADVRAGEAAAYAVMAAVQGKSSLEAAVGIGGSHCNRRLTRLGLEGKVALGHIVPSYAFKWLTPQLIQLCVERTLEKNPTIVLDWKGIDGKDRGKLCRILESVAYPVRRVAEYNVAG
jgi:D-tyrosyl-tRNA(Tyr) deacylase